MAPLIPLVLASASPRRLALLKQAGIEPAEIVAPHVDETPRKGEVPRVYALRVALAKAEAVAKENAATRLSCRRHGGGLGPAHPAEGGRCSDRGAVCASSFRAAATWC